MALRGICGVGAHFALPLSLGRIIPLSLSVPHTLMATRALTHSLPLRSSPAAEECGGGGSKEQTNERDKGGKERNRGEGKEGDEGTEKSRNGRNGFMLEGVTPIP